MPGPKGPGLRTSSPELKLGPTFPLQIFERPRAVGDLFRLHANLVENREAEVHHRRVVWIHEMTTAYERAVATTCEHNRQVDRRVVIAVAHAGAVHQDRMIQQRAV